MGNRKENLRQPLGITDYPMSSDDDDDDTQNDVLSSRARLHNGSGPAGPSRLNGQAPPPTSALSPGRRPQNTIDRETFYSILNNTRRVYDMSRAGPSSNQRIDPCRSLGVERKMLNFEQMFPFNRTRKMPMSGFPRSSTHNRNGLPTGDYLPHISDLRLSNFHPRSSRNDRIPTSSDASTSGLTLNRSAIHAQGSSDLHISNSDYELDNRSRHSMSPINVEGDDNTDTVNAASQTEHAAPEEVVVEIEPDIEVIEPSNGEPGTPPDAGANEPQNGEPSQANNEGESTEDRQGVKRKRDEHVENDINTVREFNQSVLRLLECPVCMEWMEPPMMQCRRGHLVCGPCRLRLNACPVCRTTFSSVRNRAMESVAELLRYPCRHGCGRETRLRRRASHEANCDARRYRCPVSPCAERAPFPLDELHYHFQARHLPILKMGRRHNFSMRVNCGQHETWLVMVDHDLFHLRIDVDVRMWGLVVYVAYIGPRCNAKNFTYEVTVTGQHNNRKLVYTRATHSDLESSTLNVNRQDCFHLTLDQALNFLRVKNRQCEPDKYLDFMVDIDQRDEPPSTSRDNSES